MYGGVVNELSTQPSGGGGGEMAPDMKTEKLLLKTRSIKLFESTSQMMWSYV